MCERERAAWKSTDTTTVYVLSNFGEHERLLKMGKPICINASYKNSSRIFECYQMEFLQKAAEHFKIDPKNTILFAVHKGNRRRIIPSDIQEFMRIEIIDTNESMDTNKDVRTLRSYFPNEPALVSESFVNNIITKLNNNTPLSGHERKFLVEWLPGIAGKRKYSESNNSVKKVAKHHKKVQVESSKTSVKDCFSQTDFMNVESNGTEESEVIQQKIKRLAYGHGKNASREEIAKLMNDSFEDRKIFIYSKVPPVALVRDKYPLLFSFEQVKSELERLFYLDICKEFIENMKMYAKPILDCCNSNDDVRLRTMKSIERAKTETQKSYARVVGSIFALSKLLEEDARYLHLLENPQSSSNIYPYIDASCYTQKDIYFDNILFHIIVEEQKLCEAPNFLEAILCLVGSFFIFNIEYPPYSRRTLIVFEKLFLNSFHTTDLDEMTEQMIKMLQLKAADAAKKRHA